MKMRSIKKRQSTQSESPFWISFADLMSALMILFLVVMAVSLVAVTKDINEEVAAEDQRAKEILNICHDIKNIANIKQFSSATVYCYCCATATVRYCSTNTLHCFPFRRIFLTVVPNA